MRIEGTPPAGGPGNIKKKQQVKGKDSAKFDSLIHKTEDTQAPSPLEELDAPAAVDALLAVQEMSEGTAEQRQMDRSNLILDQLQEIQQSLLAGTLNKNDLLQLERAVASAREHVADPALQLLMDAVEIRASVEIAKYERDERIDAIYDKN